MTDSQRELAEHVARRAGGRRYYDWFTSNDWYLLPTRNMPMLPEEILKDLALAWQAQEELLEQYDCVYVACEVARIMRVLGCTRIEATFRALRAATGGGE